FHGPTLARSALANSYNIPAVKALEFTGLYGAGGFIEFAPNLGIESLTREDYGLSLSLGGGEVSLVEMTTAYSALANGGRRAAPVSVLRITDSAGNEVCRQPLSPADAGGELPACQPTPEGWGSQVLSP